MNILQVINEIVEARPDTPPADLVAPILGRVTKADLGPLVEQEVALAQRARTRSLEHRIGGAFLAKFKPPVPIRDITDDERTEMLRRLLPKSIRLGDGQVRTWGKATLDEHRSRLDMLYRQRNGLDQTIYFHEQTIELLESTGAECLADVIDDAAA